MSNYSFSKESVESLASRNYQVYPTYYTKSVCRNQKDEFWIPSPPVMLRNGWWMSICIAVLEQPYKHSGASRYKPSRTTALKPLGPGFCDLTEHVSNHLRFQLREFLNVNYEIREIYTSEDLAVFCLLLLLPHLQGWGCINQSVLPEQFTLAWPTG